MSHVKFLAKFKKNQFWAFFWICNFDFVLFWLGIWCESLVWLIMGRRGVSQNAGVLVVLVWCQKWQGCNALWFFKIYWASFGMCWEWWFDYHDPLTLQINKIATIKKCSFRDIIHHQALMGEYCWEMSFKIQMPILTVPTFMQATVNAFNCIEKIGINKQSHLTVFFRL